MIIAVGGGSVIDTSKATNTQKVEMTFFNILALITYQKAIFCDSDHFRYRFRSD